MNLWQAFLALLDWVRGRRFDSPMDERDPQAHPIPSDFAGLDQAKRPLDIPVSPTRRD